MNEWMNGWMDEQMDLIRNLGRNKWLENENTGKNKIAFSGDFDDKIIEWLSEQGDRRVGK